jgi:hypothetical protein
MFLTDLVLQFLQHFSAAAFFQEGDEASVKRPAND